MTLRTLTTTIPLSLALLCSSAIAAPIVVLENNNSQLYSGNAVTGAFTLLATTTYNGNPVQLTDLAFSPSGTLYGDDGGSLYTLNSGGVLTLVGVDTGTTDFLNSLVFGSNGTLYAAGGDDLYSLSTTNGAATLLGSGAGLGTYSSAGDLSFDGATLYLTSHTGTTDELFSLNPSTGAGTDIGNIGFTDVYGLVNTNNMLYGFTDSGQEITINPSTGLGTLAFLNTGVDAFGAAVIPAQAATPEPGTAGAILLGLTGLVTVIRRRRS